METAFFDSDATFSGVKELKIVLLKNFDVNSHLKFGEIGKSTCSEFAARQIWSSFTIELGLPPEKQEKLRSILNSYQKYYGGSWDSLIADGSKEVRKTLTDVFRDRDLSV